jgi:DNA-binding XRE family transcriptional regulator
MSMKKFRKLPRILKINEIDGKGRLVSVLFSNGENRILDFTRILKEEWQVTNDDPEHILIDPKEFAKVQLENNTLTWHNVPVYITGEDGNKVKVPFDVGADVLYELSTDDHERNHDIGELFRQWRVEAKMTQDEVAVKSGTSRTYITKLENGRQDIELKTLFKIVEGGLGKELVLTVK